MTERSEVTGRRVTERSEVTGRRVTERSEVTGRLGTERSAVTGRRVTERSEVAGWLSTGRVAVRRFPTLTVATPRLDVRPLTADDATAVGDVLADKQTERWLPFPQEYGKIDAYAWCTEMAAERRDSGTGDHYGIVRREDDQIVGCLWTKRTDWVARVTEVAYAVAPHARGYGVAAEAVDALTIALILEHAFQRIELRVAPGNMASRRVAEKAGFTYEGLLRNAGYVHSGRVDLEVWSLVAADIT